MSEEHTNLSSAVVRPGATVGPYRVVKVLADGPSGIIFEAVNSQTDHRVALRRLPDRIATEPAAAEIILAGAGIGIDHPNVVAVHGIERLDGDTFLVMEFVEGRPVKVTGNRMPWRVATRIIRDAVRGLVAIHNAGLVHGQVRPGHLIVTHDGTVKIADLGLAGLDDRPVDPRCAAPELIGGHPPDFRTDIYALGATYFTLLTGGAPFADAGNPIDVYDAILHQAVPTVRAGAPEIPLRCDAIVHKAMAKDPAARYLSADALLADLDALLTDDEPTRRAPLPKLPRPRPPWRRPVPLLGGLHSADRAGRRWLVRLRSRIVPAATGAGPGGHAAAANRHQFHRNGAWSAFRPGDS